MRAGLLATCFSTTQAFTSGQSLFRGYMLNEAKPSDFGLQRVDVVKVGGPAAGTEADCRSSELCMSLDQTGSTKQYMTFPSVNFEVFVGFSLGIWFKDSGASDAGAGIFDWSDSAGADNIRAIRSSGTSVSFRPPGNPQCQRAYEFVRQETADDDVGVWGETISETISEIISEMISETISEMISALFMNSTLTRDG